MSCKDSCSLDSCDSWQPKIIPECEIQQAHRAGVEGYVGHVEYHRGQATQQGSQPANMSELYDGSLEKFYKQIKRFSFLVLDPLS